MNKEVKFNLDEDILFQIAMMTYSECNSEIATIYDHLGEEYGYSDLRDAKEYELKYEKDLLEHAVSQLQYEYNKLKERIDKAIEYIENNGHGYDITGDGYYSLDEDEQKKLLEILKGNDEE